MELLIKYLPLAFVIFIVLATVYLGIWATKKSRTASDFFVASRSVGVGMNAAAISGEYLSAASFMGVAAMVMKYGYDPLWYPVCYAAGYLFLLLFIAGPLRRFGAYTIPDFAEGRFDSPGFRKIAVIFVLFIGFFYTMPQMKGAGITMGQILNWPYWVGIAVVGTVITFNVALGGMKGITFVQAFQYWAKMFAISAPVFVIMTIYGSYNGNMNKAVQNEAGFPQLSPGTVIPVPGIEKPLANKLAIPGPETTVTFPQGAVLLSADTGVTTTRGMHGPVTTTRELVPPPIPSGGNLTYPAGQQVTVRAVSVGGTRGNLPQPAAVSLVFEEPATVRVDTAMATPGAQSNSSWLRPFGTLTSKHGYPLLYTYSLIMALVCGTAGLPHILVRFYTNPDGRAAKRTTFWVMVLIGVFYIFTPVWGAIGRFAVPELYTTAKTDAVVIALPKAVPSPLLGAILSGITSAGAFAAFMSTFSGLLVSMSGALAHDVYGRILRPNSSPQSRMTAFKISAVAIGGIAMALGLLVERFDIAKMVGWAFAIGAASYFPLLLMGSWWRGMTRQGAAAGMLIGGVLSVAAIVITMLIESKTLNIKLNPLLLTVMEQPAIWGVPLSISIMVIVSLMTSKSVPADVDMKMLRLHAPEEMGLSKNYIEH